MKRIAHIVSDEKFIDSAFNIFNLIENCKNTFYCLHLKANLEFIKCAEVEIIKTISNEWVAFLDTFDLVIFHSLIELRKKELLARLKETTQVLWIGWGADYYHLMGSSFDNLYLNHTDDILKLMKVHYRRRKIFELGSFKFYQNQIDKFKRFKLNNTEWISKINFFAPVLKSEYEIVKKNNPNFNAQFLEWNYPINLNTNLHIINKKSQVLLVGNSASYYNNHVDALLYLSKFKTSIKKIIAPLNYGGEPFYINKVVKNGIEIFDDKFFVLIEFYSKDKYYEIIENVSHAIFFSKRQLAMGNIYFLLSNGAKVFLLKQNPAFQFLKEKGFIVFSIDEICEKKLTSFLTKEESLANFTLAHDIMAHEKLLKNTRCLINSIPL